MNDPRLNHPGMLRTDWTPHLGCRATQASWELQLGHHRHRCKHLSCDGTSFSPTAIVRRLRHATPSKCLWEADPWRQSVQVRTKCKRRATMRLPPTITSTCGRTSVSLDRLVPARTRRPRNKQEGFGPHCTSIPNPAPKPEHRTTTPPSAHNPTSCTTLLPEAPSSTEAFTFLLDQSVPGRPCRPAAICNC